ncbi:MAG TPA: aldo/keto reductase [Bryobacteraceae bacterium]|nr:aldo/keto reductase [Bryobacteraceae bacterium]
MDRREFIAAAAAVPSALAKQSIPRRPYKPDVPVSVIAFGGIVVVGQEQAAANRMVAASFDRGINYYDVAPSYWDGEAEIKLGEALKPYRTRVFLACKTQKRDAEGARAELERSLQRLHTDHFDLYQFHAVSSIKDVDEILRVGGAGDLFIKARDEGKVRFLGVSAHSAEAAIKLMDNYPLDSILFPVSFNTWAKGKFGPQILDFAKRKNITRLALKAMALGRWPKGTDQKSTKYPKCWYQPIDDPVLAEKALRWTLSQDITAAVPPGDERLYELALDIASRSRPMKEKEREALLTQPVAAEPLFKA